MSGTEKKITLVLDPVDNRRLDLLCGPLNRNLKQIETNLDVEIKNRANTFQLNGNVIAVTRTEKIIRELYNDTMNTSLGSISEEAIHLRIVESGDSQQADDITLRLPNATVRGRTANQKKYLRNILRHDLSFGIGPAGTGKTWLAVAAAVNALEQHQVERIILSRPAVEAGEKLGFLPGDMTQKIDPYLRPLQDALFSLMGPERIERHTAAGRVEVLPLAFMRGRTLNNAFILLDEAQNATMEQVKMFITRIGISSTMVVNGDITQVDLPNPDSSGLRHSEKLLAGIAGIAFTSFNHADVVRHPLVTQIIQAYEKHNANTPPGKATP